MVGQPIQHALGASLAQARNEPVAESPLASEEAMPPPPLHECLELAAGARSRELAQRQPAAHSATLCREYGPAVEEVAALVPGAPHGEDARRRLASPRGATDGKPRLAHGAVRGLARASSRAAHRKQPMPSRHKPAVQCAECEPRPVNRAHMLQMHATPVLLGGEKLLLVLHAPAEKGPAARKGPPVSRCRLETRVRAGAHGACGVVRHRQGGSQCGHGCGSHLRARPTESVTPAGQIGRHGRFRPTPNGANHWDLER